MTRIAHKGIPVLEQAGPEQIKEFNQKLLDLGYKKLTAEQKLAKHVNNGWKKPKRANAENALQDVYEHESKTGLTITIYTGIIGDAFSDRGSAWAILENEKAEKIFVREFYKNYSASLLRRLYAYAEFLKIIVDQRPAGSILEEVSKLTFIWRPVGVNSDNPRPIIWKDKVSETSQEIISIKERKHKNYFTKSEGHVAYREKDVRSTWKDKK